ncbi:UvrD-helicase domain-containing protein [Wenzhouxiangella sp. XN79A]|uniref:UvrD-helicase domain-containing protein n=1 Tax=Wenzhouxiangella sp. XN79A TaxID=2724193 RepID=UPI00144AD193|nr:UvrD-helicase domain-containing protein [Wenzhouxiangella sp. XN79A]NKI36596.1 UvrD-helicase domain-containing protein [Wenzhouxiangella sp. XN79A]
MSDAEQRRHAVRPDRSVIVQAPAGSGKTTLLVERFLALLETVEAPEEILAITFTRKAAAEMKQRILRVLEPDFSSSAGHEQDLVACAERLRHRVADWDLLANPQRLMIRTIDSFSHYLARSMPVASRLGPVPAPAEDTQPLYREAARRVLERAGEDDGGLGDALETVLLWRDHRTQDLEDLLVDLLKRREQWLRALAVTTPDRATLEGVIEGLVRERLDAARTALDDALASAGASPDALAALLDSAAERLRAADGSGALREWPGGGLPGPDPEALAGWRALGDALLTKAGTWRKGVNIGQGFPPKTPEKDRMTGLLRALAGDEGLAERLHAARTLPMPRYADEEWRVLDALIRVLRQAAAELAVVFAERGQTDFTGLSGAALTALGDDDAGYTDLGLYLDRRIRHILVDEYQDTNWAQFHLLEKLTHGWEPDDGRTLFVVGDPMQSIYRFREAEVGLFIRTRDHGIGELTLDDVRLSRNFRSRAEVVDWVNERLGPVFPEREDIAAGAVAYAPSEAGRSEGGRVDLHALPDDEAEAERIAGLLGEAIEAHRHEPDWKAAVIVRSRNHLQAILPALERHGIPFRAVKLDPLIARPVVQDLLALTRAIRLPADTAALLAVLRAPWCGLELADLHRLAGDGADPHDPAALARLDGDARERAERAYDTLARARARIGRRPLRALVEGAWHRLGGPALLERPDGDRADAAQYLDLLDAADADGLLDDLGAFEERLAAGYTAGDPPSRDVRLEILTMHGAKGLEWDLVVLPRLDRGTGGSQRDLLYWLPFTRPDGDEAVLLAPLRAADQPDNTPLIDLIRSERKLREDYESQRLLYVAATRARERLVLTTALDPARSGGPKPGRGTLLERLWPGCGADFLDALAESATAPETPHTAGAALRAPDLKRAPTGWQPPIGERLAWSPDLPRHEREVEIEFNWAGAEARRTGDVLHRLLEQVGRVGVEAFDPAARSALIDRIPALLRALGTGPETLAASAALVGEAFERTLDSETGRWILSNRHPDHACELPLTGVVDGRLVNAIIDRTFVDDNGTRWIVDYKSGYHAGGDLEGFLGEEAERYDAQLGLYRRLFEQLGETDIRTVLYLPRHDRLVETG